MEKKQNRWKSPIVWSSIILAILGFLGNLGLYDIIGIDESILKDLANIIITILVSIGVLNNPTSKEDF
jgi:uncharacterized membrane protein